MLLTTMPGVPGREIAESLGVVTGNVVHSKHLGRDIMAGLKTLVGGELKGYTEMLGEARSEATERMRRAAEDKGADAVINMRFTTSAIMEGACEILAYGTAVRLVP